MRTQIIQSANADAQLNSAIVSPQPQNNGTLPPWCESSFVAIPREFYAIRHLLSKAACEVFEGHCCNAMTTGENAGVSCQYRDNFADKHHMSTKKLDRANAELVGFNMIERLPRSRNQSQSWRILKPSKWAFQGIKFAPRAPQNRVMGDSKTNPTTIKEHKKSFEKEKQNSVAASSNSLNVPDSELDTIARLRSFGVPATTAAQLAAEQGIEVCERQMVLLEARNPKNPVGALIQSIRCDWDAPEGIEVVSTVSPQIAARMVPQGEMKREQSRADTTPAYKKADLQKPSTCEKKQVPEIDTAPDVRADAVRAHEIFLTLPTEEQHELLELARAEVQPIFRDRVGQVESPMSLGLWEIIRAKYPEKFL